MLQKSSISNECGSFELSIYQRILKEIKQPNSFQQWSYSFFSIAKTL